MEPLGDLLRLERSWVIAHRGFSARAPENTLAAFEAAIEAGADVIELDVQQTADHVPVVLHDETLDRTTTGSGFVRDTPWRELATLDAGSWFAPAFAGERVPDLEQALRSIGRRALVNIEVKESVREPSRGPEAIERQIVRLLGELGLEDRVLVSSFEHAFLPRFARLAPSLPFGLLYEGPFDAARAAARALEGGAFACLPEAPYVEEAQVRTLLEAGIPVVPYTVDDPEEAQRLLDAGVRGLVTNDPAGLLGLLEQGP